MSRVVIVGGGIGGLAAAALIAKSGHAVTLLEASGQTGGKSRRIIVGGRRIDTGPSLFTFPGVWGELARRYGEPPESAGLQLKRMEEVGSYHFRGESVSLPVGGDHPWRAAWERFEREHGGLGGGITTLLTSDPTDPTTLPALARLLSTYGRHLTTRSYLDSLSWMPEGLREVLAIHTLNAGVAPERTPALYASMPAVMARDGVFVPEGGVYEVVRALEEMATGAGVEVHLEEPVVGLSAGRVVTEAGEYDCDAVVSDLDASRLQRLLDPERETPDLRLSCSGVAVYASLSRSLDLPPHSIVLPEDPQALHANLEAGREPEQTMAFVNYYGPGEVYPNEGATLALLLTAPANAKGYDLSDGFVEREVERISEVVGLSRPAPEYFTAHEVLDPRYFAASGSPGGALYGNVRPFWRSGPLHRPKYNDRRTPWLWRVGASVHPGGGIPAVLGGAMISTSRLLRRLEGET